MWKKNGQIFKNPLEIDGRRIFNPSPEQLVAAGWTDEAPAASAVRAEKARAFRLVKTAFWTYVDSAAAKLNLNREDFPTNAYSTELLQWCTAHQLPDADIADLAVKFCGISADLSRLGRNWTELFKGNISVVRSQHMNEGVQS